MPAEPHKNAPLHRLGTCAICDSPVVQYEGTIGLVCLKDSRHDIDAGPDDERDAA